MKEEELLMMVWRVITYEAGKEKTVKTDPFLPLVKTLTATSYLPNSWTLD